MTLLPAILVLLLVAVVVWFFWPVVVDPISRGLPKRPTQTEADTIAEDLFDTWSEHRGATGLLMPPGRS